MSVNVLTLCGDGQSHKYVFSLKIPEKTLPTVYDFPVIFWYLVQTDAFNFKD